MKSPINNQNYHPLAPILPVVEPTKFKSFQDLKLSVIQQQLKQKLWAHTLVINPELLLELEEDEILNEYLDEKIKEVLPLLERLFNEQKPEYIIEELCLKELTADIRPSYFQYNLNVLEREFPETYKTWEQNGILTYEIINFHRYCRRKYGQSVSVVENADDDQTYNMVTGQLQQYLEEQTLAEQRFEKLFSPDILKDKAFLKEKLGFYEHLQTKYSSSNVPEEKMMLIILARQNDLLRKQVYPSLWMRLLQRVLAPFREKQAERQTMISSDRNLSDLKEAVAKAGFEDVSSKLAAHIKQGQREFSLPLSYYINENQKMDINLSFAKDTSGAYRFDKYQAAPTDTNKPQESKKQTFSSDDQISASQAQNLLSGRAIKIETFDINAGSKSKWIQLDFNDQDPSGNHKLKEFHKDYGFDLQKSVSQLGVKEGLTGKNQQSLLDALSRGEKPQVTIMREGKEVKLSIEANPQYKTLNVYDEHQKKISIAQALSCPEKPALKITEQTPVVIEQQSKRNGQKVR